MKNPIIFCLGNEFIKEDSFAKEIGNSLKNKGYYIININDSFQLMEEINSNENLILIDVVLGIKDVKMLKIDELRVDSIISAHDLDAGFLLKLIGNDKKIKIIGIPVTGDKELITKQVIELL